MSIFLKILGILGISIASVLGLCILLILLALFCKTKLIFLYQEEEFRLRLGFLFVRYTLFPRKEKEKKQKEREPEKPSADRVTSPAAADKPAPTPKPAEEKPEKEEQKKKKKKSRAETKKFSFSDYLGIIKYVCSDLLSHISCDQLKLSVTVATEDAAQTALSYGRINALLGPVLSALAAAGFLQKADIRVTSDFFSDTSQYSGKAEFSLRLFWAIVCIFHIYKNYF